MVQLDINKIHVRYITGINKCLEDYPTALDVLYESCVESVDDALFSTAKMENRYGIDEDRIKSILDELLDGGYIDKGKSKFKIVKTPWE